MMFRKGLGRCREIWPEACYVGMIYVLLIMLFSLLRGLLLWRNLGAAAEIPAALLVQSFLVGLRFDLAVTAYLAAPLLLLLLWRRGRKWRVLLPCFYGLIGLTLLLGLAEIEFYHAMGSRFNTLVLNAMGHPWRLLAELQWQTYPMWPYLVLWGGLMLIVILVGRWVERGLQGFYSRPGGARDDMLHLMGSVVVLALLVILSRGGVGHQTLRQGDSVFCKSPFANQLALNGLFALGRCAWEEQKQAVLLPTSHAAY